MADDASRYYQTDILVENSRRGYYDEKINFFKRVLAELQRPDLRILDVACNDGELTAQYVAYGQVTGIDINPKAVAACRKRNLECLLGDITTLSSRYDKGFDVILAGDIIEHIFDTDAFLERLYRLLAPGGRLLVTTPNLVSLGRRLMMLVGRNPFVEFSTQLPSPEYNVGHVRYYTAGNLGDQLRHHRFQNVRVYGDRIHFGAGLHIPHRAARHFPKLSRNLLADAQK